MVVKTLNPQEERPIKIIFIGAIAGSIINLATQPKNVETFHSIQISLRVPHKKTADEYIQKFMK